MFSNAAPAMKAQATGVVRARMAPGIAPDEPGRFIMDALMTVPLNEDRCRLMEEVFYKVEEHVCKNMEQRLI